MATIHDVVKLQQLVRIYGPGHAGGRGNKRADSLLSKASIIGTMTGRCEIPRTIKDDLMTSEKKPLRKKDSRVRLMDCRIAHGTTGRHRKRGRTRRVSTQCAT